MTHEEIAAMAREAGFRTGHIDLTIGDPVPFIAPASGTNCLVEVQHLVALVAEKAAARATEACAVLALDKAGTTDYDYSTCINLADAIRSRASKGEV